MHDTLADNLAPAGSETTSSSTSEIVAGLLRDILDELRQQSALLLTMKDLCRLLRRSKAALERDIARGALPPSVKIGKARRWQRDVIERWVQAGCPDARRWAALETARKK